MQVVALIGLTKTYAENETDDIPRSVSTDYAEERITVRDSTPLFDVAETPHSIPKDHDGHPDRHTENYSLLKRGVMPLMCVGGYEIFENYTGSKMKDRDFVEIRLGRSIEFEKDDIDGSPFINELLDEVLHIPLNSEFSSLAHERWETLQGSPRVWITKPVKAQDKEPETDEDDVYGRLQATEE